MGLQHQFQRDREERERQRFLLKNMMIEGSSIISLFSVTSIIAPRHARWTLCFVEIVMLIVICAAFYNFTKDPLKLPNPVR